MATQPWKLYNQAKRFLCDATIDLNGTQFDLHLFTSASNFATKTLSTLGSLTNQVASANGYTTSGRALMVTWSEGSSAAEMHFAMAAAIWTASGGNIANIKAAAIVARTGASGKAAGNKMLCFASLSSGQFTLGDGLTVTLASVGGAVFVLN